MKTEDFELMQKLLKEESGLVVQSDKIYLLESRLTPVARAHGLEGLEQLIQKIRLSKNPELVREVTEAMTTNESFFFRDMTPFDILKQTVFPALQKLNAGTKTLRIWCAAASSGQEPYSIAMIIKENQAMWNGWNIDIHATDIDSTIIEKAKRGEYSQFEVQRGLPVMLMMKYFTQEGDRWLISPEIKSMVKFSKLNLLSDFSQLATYDIVFCRNVLIYFDQETKSKVLAKVRKQMQQNGSLFLGAAETVVGISNEFKPVKGMRGIYLPVEANFDLFVAP